MSTPISTLFVDGLQATLAGITKDNGYRTDIGLSVHRGFYAHVLNARSTAFPAVVIHPGPETLGTIHSSGTKAFVTLSLPLVVAVEVSPDAQCYDLLRACTADVRRALILARDDLSQLGQHDSFQIGPAEPILSEESKFALVAMAVGISIVETYLT